MLSVRNPYIVTLIGLALVACYNQPVPTVTAARNAMSGLNAEQISACMGRPGTVQSQDNTTVWSYNTLNGSTDAPPILVDPTSLSSLNAPMSAGPQSSSFASALAPPPRPACTVTLIFNQGQVDGVNFLGPDGAQLSQSDGCGQLVQQCTLVPRTGVRTP
jgi:hypothetical protein